MMLTSFPHGVTGEISPYPTVVRVTMEYHRASKTVLIPEADEADSTYTSKNKSPKYRPNDMPNSNAVLIFNVVLFRTLLAEK